MLYITQNLYPFLKGWWGGGGDVAKLMLRERGNRIKHGKMKIVHF